MVCGLHNAIRDLPDLAMFRSRYGVDARARSHGKRNRILSDSEADVPGAAAREVPERSSSSSSIILVVCP